MCNAVEEYAKEYAEEEGAKIIIEFCLEFSLTKGEILEKLQEKLDITASKAEEYWENFNK